MGAKIHEVEFLEAQKINSFVLQDDKTELSSQILKKIASSF
jgi:hypothetical protein